MCGGVAEGDARPCTREWMYPDPLISARALDTVAGK